MEKLAGYENSDGREMANMARDRGYYFPFTEVYENKPPLPPELRPFYNVVASTQAELEYARTLQPPYVDANYSLLNPSPQLSKR